jgi:hypothetical protein
VKHTKIKIILAVMLLLICSSFALAASSISTQIINNVITTQETAEFTLSITNEDNTAQSYTIYSFTSGQGFSVDPYPLTDKIVEGLAPGDTYSTIIKISPTNSFNPGIYFIQLQVDGDHGEQHTVPLKTYLLGDQIASYLPSIKVEADMENLINPRETQSIVLHIENRNPLDLTGLEVEIQSEMAEFSVQRVIDLAPLEKKTIEFSIQPNRFQQPKDYPLFFVFKKDGEPFKVVEQEITVESLSPTFLIESQEETIFLKTFQTLIITNEGNVLNEQVVKYPANIFSGLFAKSLGLDVIKEDGGRYLSWNVELAPGESTTINVTYRYRLILYFLVILALFLSFYYFVQSPLILRKGVLATTMKGDSLEEIKVSLEIRNRSKQTLKDVTVTDILPGITHLDKNLLPGTLKPQKVKSTKHGKKVVWMLAEIEPLEHRIISYTIKPKLDVLGTIQLPRAIAEFKKKKGKEAKSYSNVFRLDLGKLK